MKCSAAADRSLLTCSRPGLSSRQGDQVQIQIGGGFDFDREVEDLTKHVGRIKQVSKCGACYALPTEAED